MVTVIVFLQDRGSDLRDYDCAFNDVDSDEHGPPDSVWTRWAISLWDSWDTSRNAFSDTHGTQTHKESIP